LDLTQAGPTVVGFDEPIPDPPSYTSWTAPAASVPAPAVDDVFASYLPQPAPLPEAPHVRPLSTLAGGASVQQPRRVFPWILLGALLAVAVAVFLVKDRVAGWIGLGGGEEEIADAGPGLPLRRPAAPAPDTTLREDMGLTSDALTTEVEPVAAPVSAPAEPVAAPPVAAAAPVSQEPPPAQPAPRPLPEVVQRKPAPAAGPAVTAIERITFEPAPGGTTVILWGNGALRAESYKTESLSGPPRALVKVLGIRKPFPLKEIAVGTSEVRRIRVGYHEESGGSLHVVLDLAGSRVRIGRVEPDGQRLRITLQAQ
ncbi:MAG TPA: hypothetical protein DD490_04750, partial [Acidobacteria bacterium]|nr:hypothetical protein [Acidobacteriota bacterium]